MNVGQNDGTTKDEVVIGANDITKITAAIANGASVSGAIYLAGRVLLAIHMPAVWTAANITFGASEDNITYHSLVDSFGTEVNINAAQATYIRLNPADWVGIPYLVIRSGTAALPVNQGALRSIILVTKAV